MAVVHSLRLRVLDRGLYLSLSFLLSCHCYVADRIQKSAQILLQLLSNLVILQLLLTKGNIMKFSTREPAATSHAGEGDRLTRVGVGGTLRLSCGLYPCNLSAISTICARTDYYQSESRKDCRSG